MDRTQEPYGQSFCRSVGAVHFLQPAENPQAGNDCIWPMVNRVGIPGISQEAIKTFLGEGHSHLTRHTSRCHTSRCHTPRSGRGSSPAGRKSRGFGPPGIPENLNVHQTDFKRLGEGRRQASYDVVSNRTYPRAAFWGMDSHDTGSEWLWIQYRAFPITHPSKSFCPHWQAARMSFIILGTSLKFAIIFYLL